MGGIADEGDHQAGDVVAGDGELPGVGLQIALDEELVGRQRPVALGQLRHRLLLLGLEFAVARGQQGAGLGHHLAESQISRGFQALPRTVRHRQLVGLPVAAQPRLHLRQREEGLTGRAAYGQGEVVVAAAPVADGGTPDTGEPGDVPGVQGRVVAHGATIVQWSLQRICL
ncbi:hypothetical protein ACFSTC_47015 [Nonomuraea ferruginea]